MEVLMTNLDELRASADKLCASLDAAASNEEKFCYNVLNELERMSWEALRISNDLKQIKEYQGV
jgi:hypothetical protein